MKLVVDANILFSALLRDGITRKIWFSPEIVLYSPGHPLMEFDAKRLEILGKFDGSEKEFEGLGDLLCNQVTVFSDEYLKPYLPAASSLSRDSKDWLYLAAALYCDADIWSRDKGFAGQGRVRIWSTTDLMRYLFKPAQES
ncbi:hypothetical protein HY095_00690 [Candidatus Micrarchaeota archaeon]|nr:hypothetical protein [Candidatus Micrarchaeota archaeon]